MFVSLKTLLGLCVLVAISSGQEFPDLVHQVLLMGYGGALEMVCGGALVDYSWVATSRKCVEGLFEKFKIVKAIAAFGNKFGGFKEHRNATSYISNAGHLHHEDIALVKMSAPFTQATELKMVTLPTQGGEKCKEPFSQPMFLKWDTPETKAPAEKRFLFLSTYVVIKHPEIIGQMRKDLKSFLHSKFGRRKKKKKRSFLGTAFLTIKIAYRVYRIFKWFSKRDTTSSTQQQVSTKEKSPPEACVGNHGWPLYCGKVMVGIETNCETSGARSAGDLTTVVDVASELDFITSAVSGKSVQSAAKTNSATRSANDGHKWGLWGVVVVVMVVGY